jgi:hypothetical protein
VNPYIDTIMAWAVAAAAVCAVWASFVLAQGVLP